MANYCIRQATTTDFDDVMKIGDVHEGIDYLWHRYHAFMEDPNATSYVYVIDGEVVGNVYSTKFGSYIKELGVLFYLGMLMRTRSFKFCRSGSAVITTENGKHKRVGFCSVFLLDDGFTYHVRAGRVKVDHRGQGVYGRLMKHVRDDFRSVTSIQQDVLVVDNINFKINKERLLQTYTVKYRKDIQQFYFKGDESIRFRIESHLCLHEMTSEEMASLLTSNEHCSRLFPNNTIIIDWVPLRLLPSNMKYIVGQNNLALASKSEDSHTTLLTVGTPVPGPIRMRYGIDIFGSDVTLLRHHLIRHIHFARSVWKTDIIFQMHSEVGESLNMAIRDTMASIGSTAEDITYTAIIVLEREFK